MPERKTTAADTSSGERNAPAAQARTVTHIPMTEEQIRAVHIGAIAPLAQPISIVNYEPDWPQHFAREAARVRAALSNRIVLLEHVGSTSVPGLAAKPKIDMLLVVADSADEPAYVPDMEAAGYVLRIREPDWYEHRLFKGPDTDINLHVFSAGCSEIDRMLLFRNRLRDNAADRRLYERTKRELARQNWTYMQKLRRCQDRRGRGDPGSCAGRDWSSGERGRLSVACTARRAYGCAGQHAPSAQPTGQVDHVVIVIGSRCRSSIVRDQLSFPWIRCTRCAVQHGVAA